LLITLYQNIEIMAVYVKPIPTLDGDVASRFMANAMSNESKRATIDFSEQVEIARSILKKSQLQF